MIERTQYMISPMGMPFSCHAILNNQVFLSLKLNYLIYLSLAPQKIPFSPFSKTVEIVNK